MSYVYNNVLYHPNEDILIESNVDTNSGIRDNSKVLDAEDNWATKGGTGLIDYRGGNYGLNADALVPKEIRGFKPILFEQMGRRK